MALRRQYCQVDLEECITQFLQARTNATLLLLDLDNFKGINDRFGHEIGDEVLMEFARMVRSYLRESDSFYRYAGDEFLVLLRGASQQEAEKIIEQMYRKTPSVQVATGDIISFQFSCAAVSLGNQYCDSPRDWIRLVDERMDTVKNQQQPRSALNS